MTRVFLRLVFRMVATARDVDIGSSPYLIMNPFMLHIHTLVA